MARRALPGLETPTVPRRRRRKVGKAVVHVDSSRCPSCGTAIVELGWAQPALFYFGGHGATILTVRRRCAGCGWQLPDELRSVNPRR